jgi:signal transduction histidine kinase
MSLFRRYLALNVVAALALGTAGFIAFTRIDQAEYDRYNSDAMSFAARIVAKERDPAPRSLEPLKQALTGLNVYRFDFWLVNEAGQVLDRIGEAEPPPGFQRLPRPDRALKLVSLQTPGPFNARKFFGVVRLETQEPRYLYFGENRDFSPPLRKFRERSLLFGAFVALLATLTTAFVGFAYLRGRARDVRGVLERLKAGELKARLPIGRADEAGRLGAAFNEMADEIEKLIGKLRGAEESRNRLIAEIAHDLKTPIASALNMLDVLANHGPKLAEDLRAETAQTACAELKYLGRLVEDLLLLYRLEEPWSKISPEHLDLAELIRTEVDHFREVTGKSVEFSGAGRVIRGDSFLLQRLTRNLLENGSRYARNHQSVELRPGSRGTVELIFADDGRGFSEEGLRNFGLRRSARVIERGLHDGISAGLGSVIAAAVARAHGGSLYAENHIDVDGSILGATVTVELRGEG